MSGKRWLILLAGLWLAMMTGAARADGKPVGGMKRRVIQQEETVPASRGDADTLLRANYAQQPSVISGPSSSATGEICEWTLTDNTATAAGNYYNYIVALLDGTYGSETEEEKNTADILYDPPRTKELSFSYTFYLPGDYYLFVDIYGSSGSETPLETRSLKITVTDGGENELTRKVAAVAAECLAEDEFHTVLNLHDWVLDHCVYDKTYTYYSAASLLLEGKGVCNSYTRALKLLLDEAGITSLRVSGYIYNTPSSAHAWNAVRIDGNWYQIDATWDDGSDDFSRRAYFAVTDGLMGIEHTPEHYVDAQSAPDCSSLDANWFVHEDTWRNYAAAMLSTYTDQMNGGRHCYSLSAPVYKTGKYEKIMQGTVTAYAMSRTVWTYGDGKECAGEFTYDENAGTISGRHRVQSVLTLPPGLTRIEEESFALTGSGAHRIVIGDSCEYIGPGAFAGMDLWELEISADQVEIDEDAFRDVPYVYVIAPEDSAMAAFARARGWEVGSAAD